MSKHNFSRLTPDKTIKFGHAVLRNAETAMTRILLHGDPGVGKSAIARAIAKLLNATLIDIRLLQLDLGALRGLEHIHEDPETGEIITKAARPEFLPPYVSDEDMTDETPRYLILLDEIGAADDAIRKAAFEMLTDHRCGPHKLGSNVTIMAATNSSEDGTMIYEFDRATADRFCHIMVVSEAEVLMKHGLENGWHHFVTSAIRANPNIITASPEDLQNNVLAQSSSRSLEKVSNCLKAFSDGRMDAEEAEWFLRGMIGNAAAEYILDQMNDEKAQFDIEQLTTNPVKDRIYPETDFGVFSMIDALSAWSTTAEKLDKAITVIFEMPDDKTSVGHDARTVFIHQVEKKMMEFNVFTKYALDPRVAPFVKSTHEALKKHDQEAAERRAA